MFRAIHELLRLTPPLVGLEDTLQQVANRQIAIPEAAARIRAVVSKPHIPPWRPRIMRIVGALAMLVGIKFGYYSLSFEFGTNRVQGKVATIELGHPIVEYEVNGQRLTCRSPTSTSPPAYSVGEIVTVLYKRDNPASAMIDSFNERWLGPVIFTYIGLCAVFSSYWLTRWLAFLTGVPDSELRPDRKQARDSVVH